MKYGLRTKLTTAFGFLVLIGISNFGFLWLAERNAAEEQSWIIHTHKVITISQELLGHLRDTETGQRGFLLTGVPEYLDPYDKGKTGAWKELEKLVNLTGDNPVQQELLATIRQNVEAKFSELEETIDLARTGQLEKALNIVKSDLGKQIMDSLRSNFIEFQAEEERLLEVRHEEYVSNQNFMRLLLAGETALLILFVIGVAVLIQRTMVGPIVRLTGNAKRLAAGEKIIDVPHSTFGGEDEMDHLVDSFNNMVHTIKASIGSLDLLQQETEAKEQRLSEIIWSTNVGTWEWNIETEELSVNERWAEITGHKLADLEPLTADSWRNLCHPEDLEKTNEALAKHFSGETEFYECETRRRHRNGSWVWVLDRGKVVEWHNNGQPHRMSGTNTDISQQKEVENMKSEFISTVSHELRTPLTSIKGSLGLIRSGTIGELPDKLQSILDIAYRNSERLVLLINDILDIEKMEAGKMDFNMKPVEVKGLIDEAIESNKGYGDEHGVRFVASGMSDQTLIMGDKDRLMQVMSNLMSNAAKFSPKDSEVRISVQSGDGLIRIGVSDDGPGIPEEFHSSIFDKFSQADSSDTRRVGGTGLGLSITKAIMETHKGTLEFETETDTAKGTGTTFLVTLPELTDIASEPDQVSLAAGPKNDNRPNILICEDEPDVATVLQAILTEAGYGTAIAGTAAMARKMLQERKFAAMTLDIGLPDQDGISLMLELRESEATRELPIIVISAKADDGKQELNGSAIGVIDWIQKPIEPATLVDRLSRSFRPLEDTRPRM
jgi:PAS domain S-box-containing protein